MFDIHLDFGRESTGIAVKQDLRLGVGALLRSLPEGAAFTRVAVISDETVGGLYGEQVATSLAGSGIGVEAIHVAPGEASKSLETAGRLYQFLADRNLGRDALLLALGGGVVSDLTGFVAATWMRGVPFAICPTTLEADVDASIGGKTAVNLPAAKNLVGAFHQPVLVAVDPGCLNTLDARDVRAGLAESIKHALITSEEFLAFHESNGDAILSLEPELTTDLILRNIRIKGSIVQEDARERRGARILLNFGHTIGHAIEACGGYALRHGECVALGMLAACRLSTALGMLDPAVTRRLEVLLERVGLPTRMVESVAPDEVLARVRNDKKALKGSRRFVLLEGVGHPVVRDDVDESAVRDAYASLLP